MKYKSIAEQIIADIQGEKLTQGQRLPSLRQLTKQLNVSMTTALNSYRSLEQLGWVVSQPKSGFFVSTPISQGDIPTHPQFLSSSKSISSSLNLGGHKSVDISSGPLGISQIFPADMPLLSLKRSIKRAVNRSDELLQSYSDPQGVRELRKALADHFGANGFAINADEICISGGCMDAIRMAILVTTEPGDAIAISSPCFNGLLKLLSSLSRRVVEIPCNEDGVDLLQLEEQFKNREIKAALFSSSYMNPHGLSLTIEQKKRLAALANKYRVAIIEDDVYGELGYENTFPLPIKYWDTKGDVLWCSSISKTLSSGLRIGWCAPGRYLDACIDKCSTEQLGHNGIMQASLADFINAGHYRKHLQGIRKIISSNSYAYRKLLLRELPCGSAISIPNGGLVLWVQVPGLDESKLSAIVDELGIDLRFGSQFTTRKLYRNCFRLNVGWRLSEMHDSQRTVEQALLQLAAGVRAVVGEKV